MVSEGGCGMCIRILFCLFLHFSFRHILPFFTFHHLPWPAFFLLLPLIFDSRLGIIPETAVCLSFEICILPYDRTSNSTRNKQQATTIAPANHHDQRTATATVLFLRPTSILRRPTEAERSTTNRTDTRRSKRGAHISNSNHLTIIPFLFGVPATASYMPSIP